MTLTNSDIDAVLAEVRGAVHRDHAHRRRRRRLAASAAALAAAVVASVAVAGTVDDWWTDSTPPVHADQVTAAMEESESVIPIDLSKEATVATITGSQLVAVATQSGGYCLTAFHDGKLAGSSCSTEPAAADGTASRLQSRTSAYDVPASDAWWIAYGRITDAHAATLDLSGLGLSTSLPLQRGGFFLFDVPRDRWAALDGKTSVVAIRDASGHTIRTACAGLGAAPGKVWSGGGGLGDDANDCPRQLAPANVQPGSAQKAFVTTLSEPWSKWKAGDTIAAWRVRDQYGEDCVAWSSASHEPMPMYTDDGKPNVSDPNAADAEFCHAPGSWPTPAAIDLSSGAQLVEADHYLVAVDGIVDPASGIAKLELVGDDGRAREIPFSHGVFLLVVGDAPRDGKQPGHVAGGPYRVVGLDAAGKVVASVPARM